MRKTSIEAYNQIKLSVERLEEIRLEYELWFCSEYIINTTKELLSHIDALNGELDNYKRSLNRSIAHMKDLINVDNSHSSYLKYAVEDIIKSAKIGVIK